MTNTRPRAALLVVDVQGDFLPPNGSLAVPGGLEVVPVIENMISKYDWDIVIASQDWHPRGHISFASTHAGKVFDDMELTDARGTKYVQKLWPEHCIQNSPGSDIAPALLGKMEALGDKYLISRKGYHKGIESYSAFEGFLTSGQNPAPCPDDIPPKDSQVTAYLRNHGITKVVVTGLATDYCVAATAVSALDDKFDVALVTPACRGITPDGSSAACEKIRARGGVVAEGEGWEKELAAWLAK